MPSHQAKVAIATILVILVECVIVSVAVDRFLGDRTWQAHVVDSLLAVAVVAQMVLLTGGLLKQEENRMDTYVEV